MIINIPKEDLQRNINLEPGWYKVTFRKMEPVQSKDKQSTNFNATFEFDCDGRSMDHGFNSKLLRMMQPFIEAVRGAKVAVEAGVVQESLAFTPEEFYGKRLQVKIDNDPWDGRLINKIKDFLPENAETGTPFGV